MIAALSRNKPYNPRRDYVYGGRLVYAAPEEEVVPEKVEPPIAPKTVPHPPGKVVPGQGGTIGVIPVTPSFGKPVGVTPEQNISGQTTRGGIGVSSQGGPVKPKYGSGGMTGTKTITQVGAETYFEEQQRKINEGRSQLEEYRRDPRIVSNPRNIVPMMKQRMELQRSQRELDRSKASMPYPEYTTLAVEKVNGQETGASVQSFDYTRWAKNELYGKGGTLENYARASSLSVTQAFNPDVWISLATGGNTTEILAKKEYDIVHSKDSGFNKWINLQLPAYENVIVPIAFGAAFKYVGAVGRTLKAGSWAARGYKAWTYGMTGVSLGLIGTDVDYTAMVNPSSLPAKGVGLASQALLFGVGYKSVSNTPVEPFFKKEITVHMNDKGTVDYFSGKKYFEVLGKKLYYGNEQFSSKMSDINKPSYNYEPPGLASSISKPTPTKPEVPYVRWNNKVFTGDTGKWQPKTGIPEPGVYTPEQMILRPSTGLSNIIPSGKLIPYEPYLPFDAMTEGMYKNKDFIAEGMEWQPQTGIKERTTKPVKWYDIEPKPLPDNILTKPRFKLKPVAPTVTKIDVTPEGILSVKKYGRSFIDPGNVKKYGVGIPEPGVYTGKQLWTTVYPKPKVYRAYETYYRFIDVTTLYDKYFGYKIKPSKPKTKITIKDILKSDTEIKTTYGGNTQRGGQQTIQIEKTIQDTISSTDTIQKKTKITVQEQSSIFKQKDEQASDMFTSKKELYNRSHIFKGLALIMNNRSESISTQSYIQSQRKSQQQIQKQKQGYLSISDVIPVSITSTEKIISFDMIKITVPDYVTTFYSFNPRTITVKNIAVKKTTIEPDVPKTPRRIIPGFPSDDESKEKKKSVKGFDVFVKDRRYVHGRKSLPERWIKVNRKPLSEHDALSLGGSAVDESRAASFKISPALGQKAKDLDVNVHDWDTINNQFYKKKNRFIEKTDYRINTMGEIRGISALGWVASRKKSRGVFNVGF